MVLSEFAPRGWAPTALDPHGNGTKPGVRINGGGAGVILARTGLARPLI